MPHDHRRQARDRAARRDGSSVGRRATTSGGAVVGAEKNGPFLDAAAHLSGRHHRGGDPVLCTARIRLVRRRDLVAALRPGPARGVRRLPKGTCPRYVPARTDLAEGKRHRPNETGAARQRDRRAAHPEDQSARGGIRGHHVVGHGKRAWPPAFDPPARQPGVSEIMGRATAYGGPFGKLSHLSPGDVLTVTTGQGVNVFRVLDVRHEGDPKPALLQAGKGRLVLATADGVPLIPAGVLRVDADLMSQVRESSPMVLTAADMSSSEQAMGTDPSAWVPLVLWGQGLVIAAILLAWARTRWGRWQVWIVAVPVMLFFGMAVADQAVRLLPNLL